MIEPGPSGEQPVQNARIGLIGGGFMGAAIASGLLAAGVTNAVGLSIAEASESRRQYLVEAFAGARITGDLKGAVQGCDAIVLAVKPQDFPKLGHALGSALTPNQLVISIMAGIRLGALADGLQHDRVVRVMPNTPASLGEGFSAWIASESVSEEQRTLTAAVLCALGREAEMHEERYLDMVTALSGSGPAYVFLFLEALIGAGVHIGLPRPLATEMALQTLAGSVAMARNSGDHPALLREAVTSPAGTTAAALQVFERAGFRGLVTEAVTAAFQRSIALGG